MPVRDAGKRTTGSGRYARRIRTCRDVIGLLTEYMEDGLSAAESHRLEAHLALCPPCAEFLASLKTTRAATRSLTIRDVPEDCRAALRAFLKKTLKK